MPRFHVEQYLASGRLVEILSETPLPGMPTSLSYPRRRQLSPRVRVSLDWAASEFAARNRSTA